uniref:Uncharacterized protein n=1 Tax=Setaria viridis TaxID=4556 RepID=A0A4U6T6K3_SETVI|nr:hypothetical protein SEVIR_9G491900v2 [Setaria viridis]
MITACSQFQNGSKGNYKLRLESVINSLATIVYAVQCTHYCLSKENSMRLQICLSQMILELAMGIFFNCKAVTDATPYQSRQNLLLISTTP